MPDRIVLFGGTFDPVHLGHTAVVENAARQLHADKVFFIPARRSPHKYDYPLAPAEHRLNMLSLALANYHLFSVSKCELERAEPSYTYDTVRHFRSQFPDAQLFWLVGADAMQSLPRWYRFTDLMDLCQVCIMRRGGIDSPAFDRLSPVWGGKIAERLKKDSIATPLVEISSTEVRARLASGLDVSNMLHPDVLKYIVEHGLYGSKAAK